MFDGWTRLFSLKKNSGNAADCFPMLQNSSQSVTSMTKKTQHPRKYCDALLISAETSHISLQL
jgi:hypothetical protein